MRVLVTGATGFMGSALAATLLARGHSVLAPGRDETGARTREAVGAAAIGLGLGAVDFTKLDVATIDLAKLDKALLVGLDAVWHVAADMSYAPARLARSFAFNVAGSVALYRAVKKASPGARFTYVSTTYVGGVSRRPIPEELHTGVLLNNTYLVTKWGAEMALHVEAAQGGPPLMIYRPPGVVGDSRTGWYGGKAFGSYNFYDGVRVGAEMGAASFVWAIDPGIVHPYLPIDAFATHAAALVEHDPGRPGTTVVHDLGSQASNEQLSVIAGDVYGVRVGFGKPTTEADLAVDAVIAPNKPFNQAGFAYPYQEGRLAEILGDRYTQHPLDEDAIRRIVAFFRDNPPTDDAS